MTRRRALIHARRFTLAPLVLGATAALAAAAPARAQWTVVNLVPTPGTNAYATCAGGTTQAGYSDVSGHYHASLWNGTAASWVDLHPAGATVSEVLGCSPTAQAGYTYAGQPHAAMWSGTAASRIDLNPPGAPSSAAYAVWGPKQVGRVATGNGDHAAVWEGSASGWVDLNPPSAASSYAFAIHDTQIVGYINTQPPNQSAHASLWVGTSFIDLNPAVATGSLGYGVHNGQQVGYVLTGGQQHAALWTGSAASFVDLNPAGVTHSRALAVHAGRQAGYFHDTQFNSRAAVWSSTAASFVNLDSFLVGSLNSIATGIWSEGGYVYVAGWYHNVISARDEPVLWRAADTPPCPADLGAAGGATGGDGHLDNNDFVVFINLFFSHDSRADLGSAGGLPGPDAQFDNNDFIAFINAFFSGC